MARLLANFDLEDLALSDPQTFPMEDAERMAVHATSHLERMRLFPTLDEALEDRVFALGTTSRSPEGRSVLSPEEGVAQLAQATARGPVALVFGGERRGLSDDELARCQAVVAIPTGDTQPSMNLAQAAAVMLYLCRREANEPPVPPVPVEGAKLGTLKALDRKMSDVLQEAGFLNPQAPEHILRELSRTLFRATLTQREAELWLSAFKQLGRAKAG